MLEIRCLPHQPCHTRAVLHAAEGQPAGAAAQFHGAGEVQRALPVPGGDQLVHRLDMAGEEVPGEPGDDSPPNPLIDGAFSAAAIEKML